MQREIKFRAWVNNTMEQWDHVKSWQFLGTDLNDKEIKWMQYTGLKDKNGVEIYEGDILREIPKNDWEMTNYSCFEVFFHDGDAHADYNIGFTMNRMHNHGSICGGYIPSFKPKTVSKMEVIGTVFENPELINQVK